MIPFITIIASLTALPASLQFHSGTSSPINIILHSVVLFAYLSFILLFKNLRYPYCRVHTVTTSARVVTLNLLEDDGSVKGRNYQLATNRLASSLYRSITEIHAFFRCDSVRDTVLWQTTRDLKDALVSIFDHNGECVGVCMYGVYVNK